MGWKELPYWLKGGIISFLFLGLYIFFIFLNIGITADVGYSLSNVWVGAVSLVIFKIYMVFMLPLFFVEILYFKIYEPYISSGVFEFLTSSSPAVGSSIEPSLPLLPLLGFVGLIIILPIYFFAIGALIGWIYGKIKQRKA